MEPTAARRLTRLLSDPADGLILISVLLVVFATALNPPDRPVWLFLAWVAFSVALIGLWAVAFYQALRRYLFPNKDDNERR